MTPDIPALREALARAKMDTPLDAEGFIVFGADGEVVAECNDSVRDARLLALAVNALGPLLDRLEKAEDIASFAECRRVCATDMTPCFRFYRGREDLWCEVCEYRAERAKTEAPDGR